MPKDRPLESYIWQLLKAALALAAVVIYSRYLGAAGRGSLSIYLLYVQMLLMVNELFVGSALANWIAQYGLRRFLPRILSVSLSMLSLAALLAWLGGITDNAHVDLGNTAHLNPPYILLLLLLGWSAILIFQNVAMNFFQSRGDILEKNRWLVGFEFFKVGGLITLIGGLSVEIVPLDYVVLSLVFSGLIWSIFCLSRLASLNAFTPFNKKADLPSIRHTWNEGIWAQTGQIVLFMVYRTPLLLTSYLMGDAAAGIFANTLLVIDTIWIFANTLGAIVHGRALGIFNEFKREKLGLRFATFSFWGTFLLSMGAVAIPMDWFARLFGAEFDSMSGLLWQSLPGIWALGFFAPLGNLFHAQNQFKQLLLHHSIGLVVMAVLLLIAHVIFASITVIHLIWTWNFALSTILGLHIFRRKFMHPQKDFFKVNTLLIYRLVRKLMRF
jgi:O-antigen/teichoic acid export membrane protein